MRSAWLFAVGITLTSQASVGQTFWDGEKLYDNCTAGDLPVCVGYLMAVLDLSNSREFGPVSTQTFGPRFLRYCFTDKDVGRAVDAVVTYLRDHPESRHLAAADLAIRAMAEAFPCRT